QQARAFRAAAPLSVLKPYLLADIGEGITECQVIQWFVQPGARVEQFDKICEVQSDKATVEITSRFDGVIKKLYYEADDVARVGKPLVDIDIQSEISPEDEAILSDNDGGPEGSAQKSKQEEKSTSQSSRHAPEPSSTSSNTSRSPGDDRPPPGKHATLATPAVRHMLKQYNLEITDISGTGRDGRVLKEDVQKHVAAKAQSSAQPTSTPTTPTPLVGDKDTPLTAVQRQMFKTMTRSLSIPHFLYTSPIDFTNLSKTRRKLNSNSSATTPQKLSALPFIVKAVSLALTSHPILNAHLHVHDLEKPQLIHKAQHDIGIAIDTPSGLLVPVVRHVQAHTIASLASEIARLGALARDGKLGPNELSGATFTVSNIGSIGGAAVAPVIVTPQVGILGVGRARVVPAFGEDGEIVRREECVFSWSADHRVVDGATAARCAELVRGYLEDVEGMLVAMR
ncbi:hypothetical protein K490DRAFT_12939, partial [Saccharata proteae CBS 121410]